jgi:hypothetical protein
MTYEIRVPHTDGSVTFTFDSTLDQAPNDESYGFRDFVLTAFTGYNSKLVKSWFTADNWEVKDFKVERAASQVTSCGERKVFGGKGTFGLRTEVETSVSIAEKHDWVRVVYTVAFIDSWDARDWLTFSIDGVPVRSTQRTWGRTIEKAQCSTPGWGARFHTTFTTYIIEFPHTTD